MSKFNGIAADFDTAIINGPDGLIYIVFSPCRPPCFPLSASIIGVELNHFVTAVAILKTIPPENHCPYNVREAIAVIYDLSVKDADNVLIAATHYLAGDYSHSDLGIRI